MKIAGYTPDNNQTTNGVIKSGTRTCHFNKIFIESCCHVTLLSQGKVKYQNRKASAMAIQVIITDSLRNWKINSFLRAPTTFRIPISFARNADRAVERFI